MSRNSIVKSVTAVGNRIDPLQLLETVIGYGHEWMVAEQRGRVERKRIDSWRELQLDRIRRQQEMLLKALELTFDERRGNFGRMFDALDAAIAEGDISQAASILESITDLAKTSPFEGLQNLELVIDDLKQPEKVWDV